MPLARDVSNEIASFSSILEKTVGILASWFSGRGLLGPPGDTHPQRNRQFEHIENVFELFARFSLLRTRPQQKQRFTVFQND